MFSLDFNKRAIIHMLLTLIATFKIATSVQGLFMFLVIAIPSWLTIFMLVKFALEPFEMEKKDES